ncbi:MAG: hypothetical protein ACREQ9_15425 [Candidatus Binatia bacterium]
MTRSIAFFAVLLIVACGSRADVCKEKCEPDCAAWDPDSDSCTCFERNEDGQCG